MNFNNPHHKFSNFLVSRFLYILKNNESPKVLLFLQITPIAFSILEIKTEKSLKPKNAEAHVPSVTWQWCHYIKRALENCCVRLNRENNIWGIL